MSLPIQKLAAKSCDAADSEISNDGEVVSGFTFFFVFINSIFCT
jgi:hypothetical protein